MIEIRIKVDDEKVIINDKEINKDNDCTTVYREYGNYIEKFLEFDTRLEALNYCIGNDWTCLDEKTGMFYGLKIEKMK